jgi:hypothetical protein
MKTPLAMTNSGGFQSFYDKWVEEFQKQKNNKKLAAPIDVNRFWGGTEAFDSLSKANALDIVMPTAEHGDNLPKRTLRGLYREIEIYKRYRNRISDINNKFKDAMDQISQALHRVSKMPKSVSEVAASRNRCIGHLKRELEIVKDQHDNYWDDALLALPEERAKWPVMMTGRATNPVRAFPPNELMIWEENLPITLKSRKPKKSIDLDTRFQIRIAKTLQFYFNEVPQFYLRTGRQFRVPLMTVSRLVVLTYIAAQLSTEKHNKIFVACDDLQNARALSVESIYQKLRDAGLK